MLAVPEDNKVTAYLLQQIQLLVHRDRAPDGNSICQAGGSMDILFPGESRGEEGQERSCAKASRAGKVPQRRGNA